MRYAYALLLFLPLAVQGADYADLPPEAAVARVVERARAWKAED